MDSLPKNNLPPKLAQRFLLWFLKSDLAEEVQGDLEEKFEWMLEETTPFKAKLNYWYQVFHYLRPFAIRKTNILNSIFPTMIRHNFKISWRTLLKNKGYSLINIGGLALGMTVAILISLWIHDELSYNKHHENYDRIAKVMQHRAWRDVVYTNDALLTGMGTLLRDGYQDQFEHVVMVRQTEEHIIANGEKKFTQKGNFMQPEGPELFSLKMLHGTRSGLDDQNAILLSESLAKKLFPSKDPMGQTVTMDATFPLTVKGVYADLPNNSEFREASYFAPLNLFFSHYSSTGANAWENYNMYIYVQIQAGRGFEQLSSVINKAFLPHIDATNLPRPPETFLQPMRNWHLYSEYDNGVKVTSNRLKFVWFYGVIGVFVLFLACINFMNLSTARSEKRAKEIGVRKSLGSLRSQLINQFLSESILVAFIAFVFSIWMVQMLLPWFNGVADKKISILWANPWFWLAGLSFTLITALLAGSYPAFYLSSFDAVKVLKGTFRAGRFATLPRRILVVFQFTISIALIIGTIIVYEQIQHAKNRPVGYAQEGLLTFRVNSPEFRGKYDLLSSELKKTGAVSEMAESNYPLTNLRGSNNGFDWDGRDANFDPSFNTIRVTHDYGKTVGWQFIAGRDFSKAFPQDKNGVIITESAAKLIGFENPVGQRISFKHDYFGGPDFTILGVVKDMVKGSPFEPTHQSIIFLYEGDLRWLFIRIDPTLSTGEALPKIKAVFNQLFPTAPFDYQFVDEVYGAKFREEERIGTLAGFFSILAILISCLGLFGLAAFVAEQRTREIGIRKVLGASVLNLWKMLSKDFVQLVIIACFVAIPIAYYFLEGWLESYEYRINISSWIPIVTGLGALFITLITVSFQAIKVATANPVKALRSE